MQHDFFASHHGSSPHDNYGKVPRTKMREAEAFQRDRIADYHRCFEFCVKHMPLPAKQRKPGADVGTWTCNGLHKWRAYSSGTDLYKNIQPHVPHGFKPPEGKVLCGVKGSQELYGYRGMCEQKSESLPVSLNAKFILCYCDMCREGRYDLCLSKEEFAEKVGMISAYQKRNLGTGKRV